MFASIPDGLYQVYSSLVGKVESTVHVHVLWSDERQLGFVVKHRAKVVLRRFILTIKQPATALVVLELTTYRVNAACPKSQLAQYKVGQCITIGMNHYTTEVPFYGRQLFDHMEGRSAGLKETLYGLGEDLFKSRK